MRDAKGRGYRFDKVEVDVSNLRLAVGTEVRALEPKSFRLLVFLVENPGRALTKDEIMAAVWPDTAVSDNSLARAIAQIRKAIDDDPKAPRYVETVPTVGYRFIGQCLGAADLPATVPGPAAPTRGGLALRKALQLLAAGVCAGLMAGLGFCVVVIEDHLKFPYPLHVIGVSKLTTYPGDERDPAVSPDGSTVAFSWSGPAGDNYDIYVTKMDGQQPLRLTSDPAPDTFPAWSADGTQIAFLRRSGLFAQIVVVSALGGPERVLDRFPRVGADLDFSQHPVLCWSHDGQWIVFSGQSGAGGKYQLFALSVATGAVRTVTSPSGDVAGDSSPALSGDGKFLAFVRYLAPLNGELFVQPLDPGVVPRGDPTAVKTSGLAPRSPIWLEDGRQLLFAGASQIFQWDRKNGTVPVYAAAGALGGMSLGPPGPGNVRPLVVALDRWDSDIWDIPLNAGGTKSTGPPQVLQRSTESDAHPDYSPDGRYIAFASARSGAAEIWVANADGSNPRQLTHLGAHVASYPTWSPDGARIAFHARVPDISEIYVVDVDQGVPRQITHQDPGLALATWSGDRRSIYASTLVGGSSMEYRVPLDGGPMERLWPGAFAKESADRRYLLYWKSNAPGIYRRALAGDVAKNPEELVVPDFWPQNQLGGYAPVAGGIYYVSGNAQGRPGPFRYFDYATRGSTDVAPAVPGLGRGFAVAPDRRRLSFAASAEVGGTLVSIQLQ